MNRNFFSMVMRMKHMDRWGLMRNTWKESLSEHTLDVCIISHALAVIGNTQYGKNLDSSKITTLALYHDASEILTGDMPTPVKYQNPAMIQAYKNVEREAVQTLYGMIPESMQEAYREILFPSEADAYLWKLVKAADRISALIKCLEEENAGNQEFMVAKESQRKSIGEMQMPEADFFLQEFLEGYTKTLDEQ